MDAGNYVTNKETTIYNSCFDFAVCARCMPSFPYYNKPFVRYNIVKILLRVSFCIKASKHTFFCVIFYKPVHNIAIL